MTNSKLLLLALICAVSWPLGAQTFTVLHAFTSTPDGGNPQGSLLVYAGSLYGTTFTGGALNLGTVFQIDSSGNETVLYSFGSTSGDGFNPTSWLIRDASGDLYGTTSEGGSNGFGGRGAVFKLNPRTAKERTLYSFAGLPDGETPIAGLVRDSSGSLYGTTLQGGTGDCSFLGFSGCGIAYKIDSAGVETVLHDFLDGADGAAPEGGLVMNGAGSLFGATYEGLFYGGAIFAINSGGEFKVVDCFVSFIRGSLFLSRNGLLYAGTLFGGSDKIGTLLAISPSGNVTTLYTFSGTTDGGEPYSGVVQDKAGNLYGTTYGGGANGFGTVFKVDAKTHALTTLHSFSGQTDGEAPIGGLALDSVGNVYGTTSGGGPGGQGTVFKITP